VVGDEVQRLAGAGGEIDQADRMLVRTIQTDTNEAVVQLERSTTDVSVARCSLRTRAPRMEEIEQVSNQIGSLVQNISAARAAAGAAQNIARNMQVLKEISAQTAESTNANLGRHRETGPTVAGLRKAAAASACRHDLRPIGATEPSKRSKTVHSFASGTHVVHASAAT